MVWTINDGAVGDEAGSNCALVSAAALFSHVTRQETTSGALMRRHWHDLICETGNNTQSLARIEQLRPSDMDQSPQASLSLVMAKDAVTDENSNRHDNFDAYLNYTQNKPGGYELFKSAPFRKWQEKVRKMEEINQSEFDMVRQTAAIACERAQISMGHVSAVQRQTARDAVQAIGKVTVQSGKCLFAIHSRRLGHWLLGHARVGSQTAGPKDLWHEFGIELHFADYQCIPPRYCHLPFLGLEPSEGSGQDQNDIVIIANTAASGVGWPDTLFDGLTETVFRGLVLPGGQGASHSGQSVLDAPLGAETKRETDFAKDT